MFNYIITIHNKQDLLPRVLEGVALCCSKQSKIIPVLDGCTDHSEEIVDEFIATSGLNVEKVITPDVYELHAINAGMACVTEGFIMTIQDDVVMQEPELEQKISALCDEVGPTIGVISPRHGTNVRRVPFLRQLRNSGLVPLIDEYERVTRPEEAPVMGERVDYGHVSYRMVAGGSPMIFPERVWKSIGRMDESMAPLMWFDHEYNLRSLQAGYRNAVFPLSFESEIDWGTMRQKTKSDAWISMVRGWTLSNRRYVWKKHGRFIDSYLQEQGKPTWAWM
ncbi:MAG: glycosyltransferase [Caldilineaceae bacterium]|nr:glycosyltransferase [Caldilineaceae bacterium]